MRLCPDTYTRFLHKPVIANTGIDVGMAFLQVIQTFQAAAELGNQSLSAYVISMAKRTSDVLAVELLQREAHLTMTGPRFVSSKSSSIRTARTMSPAAAQANAAAPTVNGSVSAPFAVPNSVNSRTQGDGPETVNVKQAAQPQSKDAGGDQQCTYCQQQAQILLGKDQGM